MLAQILIDEVNILLNLSPCKGKGSGPILRPLLYSPLHVFPKPIDRIEQLVQVSHRLLGRGLIKLVDGIAKILSLKRDLRRFLSRRLRTGHKLAYIVQELEYVVEPWTPLRRYKFCTRFWATKVFNVSLENVGKTVLSNITL